MKKLCVTLVAMFAITQFSYAQWTNQTGTGNYYLTSGFVGIGLNLPSGRLTISGNSSTSAWGANGINLQLKPATYTDTPSSGTQYNVTVANSFGISNFVASNAVNYLTASTPYVSAPQHLPDMPSEQEVVKDGLNLGEIVKNRSIK